MIMVSVCLPSDASHNTYHLTWVSLPSTWSISSRLLQQSTAATPYLVRGVSPHGCLSDLERGVALLGPLCPCSHHSLDVGLILSAVAPDLGCGVAPPGRRL